MSEIMTTYTSNDNQPVSAPKLKVCPLCGGHPMLHFTGNMHTRSRSVEITCSNCYLHLVVSAGRFGSDWCCRQAVMKWNRRYVKEEPLPLSYGEKECEHMRGYRCVCADPANCTNLL